MPGLRSIPKSEELPAAYQGRTGSGRIHLTSCLARIESALSHNNLFPAEQKIAEYILANPNRAVGFSVQELAEGAQTSRATIVRFCRTLDYSGYKEFKLALAAEFRGTVNLKLENLSRDDDIMSITRKVFNSDLQAIADSLAV